MLTELFSFHLIPKSIFSYIRKSLLLKGILTVYYSGLMVSTMILSVDWLLGIDLLLYELGEIT
jgi:hypothetical protein